MIFLSPQEKHLWAAYARDIQDRQLHPDSWTGQIRTNLIPAFYFYIATVLLTQGPRELADLWLVAGRQAEQSDIFLSGYLIDYLKRYNGEFTQPGITFQDPRSYAFMKHIPFMADCRQENILQFADSLPVFTHPVRYVDIGCGDGDFTVQLLRHLVAVGKVASFSDILLVDPSAAMVNLAEGKVASVFPKTSIHAVHAPIQTVSSEINEHYDIALCSLSFHHMPAEDKRVHLGRIIPWIDHLLLFELDADHDTPQWCSPELAVSVYQAYGQVIELVRSYEAPPEVIMNCVDCFWMSELISILSEPRGVRSDYHMLRYQWIDLCRSVMGQEFTLLSEATPFAERYVSLFSLHFGRSEETAR